MQYLVYIAAGFLLLYTLSQESAKATKEGNMTKFNDLFKKHANRKGLDWRLLKAIATVESSLNPQAYNPNDPSYGLMQLLCRQDGASGTCTNRLNVSDWPPENPNQLFDPDYSIHIASQILRWNIDNYGFKRGIATYNAWSAHKAPPNGPFPNQDYVDKVLSEYRNLGGHVPREG
jgi:soluble lytic murein transglycosylase-like protein